LSSGDDERASGAMCDRQPIAGRQTDSLRETTEHFGAFAAGSASNSPRPAWSTDQGSQRRACGTA
jgi:hypothetical protein